MQPVIIYSTRVCGYCTRAKNLLTGKQVPFTEILIDVEPDKRREMELKSGGLRTVPQIFIGEHHIGGFHELFALDRRGDLESLLQS